MRSPVIWGFTFYQEPIGKMGVFLAMFVTPNSLKYNESGNLETGRSDERFPLLVESVIHRYDRFIFLFYSSAR